MKNNKRKIRYLVLILLLLFISIGYAVLSTNLNITGASTINNPTWDIHWENVSVKSGSVTASTPTIDTAKTTVTYSVNLTTPGDFYEFTVDAKNAGSIDGMIDVISNKVYLTSDMVETSLPTYLEYSVSYEDDVHIASKHLLKSGTSEKYKVHVGYKKNISQNEMPRQPESYTFKISITYVQSDSSAIDKPISYFTISNTYNQIGNQLPNVTTYTNYNDAITAFGHPFFLKHTVSNNTIIDSYVGFVVTPEMANNNPGMTAGTYYLKGKKTQELVDHNWQCMSEYDDGNGNCLDPDYNTNKDILLSAFGSSYCTDNSFGLICHASGLNARADSNGSIGADDDALYCSFSNTGYSSCGDLD